MALDASAFSVDGATNRGAHPNSSGTFWAVSQAAFGRASISAPEATFGRRRSRSANTRDATVPTADQDGASTFPADRNATTPLTLPDADCIGLFLRRTLAHSNADTDETQRARVQFKPAAGDTRNSIDGDWRMSANRSNVRLDLAVAAARLEFARALEITALGDADATEGDATLSN